MSEVDGSASGLVIACPMRKEAEALEALLGEGTPVLATGLGVKRTLPSLLKLFRLERPSLLVFTGSASQLDLSLPFGTVLVPGRWCFENGRCFATAPLPERIGPQAGWVSVPQGLTVNRPVVKAQHRRRLHEELQASLFDSVTAAVVRLCETEQVQCATPKILANTVDSGLTRFWNDLEANLHPLAEGLRALLDARREADGQA